MRRQMSDPLPTATRQLPAIGLLGSAQQPPIFEEPGAAGALDPESTLTQASSHQGLDEVVEDAGARDSPVEPYSHGAASSGFSDRQAGRHGRPPPINTRQPDGRQFSSSGTRAAGHASGWGGGRRSPGEESSLLVLRSRRELIRVQGLGSLPELEGRSTRELCQTRELPALPRRDPSHDAAASLHLGRSLMMHL